VSAIYVKVASIDLNQVSFKKLVFPMSELSLQYLVFVSSFMVVGRERVRLLYFLEKGAQ